MGLIAISLSFLCKAWKQCFAVTLGIAAVDLPAGEFNIVRCDWANLKARLKIERI